MNLSKNYTSSLICSDNFGPKQDSLYIIIPIILIYIIIFITGLIGNISTCIVIAKNKVMHTATNYYLFSLAISDLLLLISGIPQEIYLIYSRYPYIFGSVFCFLRGLFAETSANATVLTITAFTVERYLAICHPFLSHTLSKLSRAVKLILTIWMIAICLAIPQALQFQITGPPECEMCQYAKPIIKYSFELSTLLFFVLPMTIITVLYMLIGHRLKASSIIKRQNSHTKAQTQSSKKIVKMLVAVVVAFFICWAPFHTQRLYFMYSVPLGKQDQENYLLYQKIYDIVTYISGILYYISATINPILYNIMSVKFRDAFKETFAQCCGLKYFKTNRPQRSYSVLSRSIQREFNDSCDSAKEYDVHTNTSLTHKTSIDSFNGIPNHFKRNRTLSTLRTTVGEEENLDRRSSSIKFNTDIIIPTQTRLINNLGTSSKPINKFCNYFNCIKSKRTIENPKEISVYYTVTNTTKENIINNDVPVNNYIDNDVSNENNITLLEQPTTMPPQ